VKGFYDVLSQAEREEINGGMTVPSGDQSV
jgi:hypothetical protein